MISAWSNQDVSLVSPNKKYRLSIVFLHEVAMGAPTSGALFLDGKKYPGRFGPSAVWSDNSKYCVIPKWDMPNQLLSLIDVETGKIHVSPTRYSVLELKSLEKGILTGIESPIYEKRTLHLVISSIFNIV